MKFFWKLWKGQRRRSARRICARYARATLRHAVEELLQEHFSNDSLIAGPAVAAERNSAEAGIEEAPTAMVGHYKLLERSPRVASAQSGWPSTASRVALKIIKPGMDSRQVVARFEAERQALAKAAAGLSSGGVNTFNDYVTIRYSSAGVALWTNRYDGLGNADDFATGWIAVATCS